LGIRKGDTSKTQCSWTFFLPLNTLMYDVSQRKHCGY
jgi:hypothetical protein